MEETNSNQSEQNFNSSDQSFEKPKNPKNNKKIVFLVLILLAVALIGFLAFALLHSNDSTDKSLSTTKQATKVESKKQHIQIILWRFYTSNGRFSLFSGIEV